MHPDASRLASVPSARTVAARCASCAAVVLALVAWGVLVAWPNRPRDVRLDLRSEASWQPAGDRAVAVSIEGALPRALRVLEDGRPLPRLDTVAGVAEHGGGRWGYDPVARTVVFSASDSTSPLMNGRRYVLVGRSGGLPRKTTIALLLGGLGLATAAAVALRARAARLNVVPGAEWQHDLAAIGSWIATPSPRGQVAAALAAGMVTLGLALSDSWDRVAIEPDSDSYLAHYVVRTPAYPWFLNLLVPESSPLENGTYVDPGLPLLRVARAQKLLFAVSAAALFLVLASRANAWFLLLAATGLGVYDFRLLMSDDVQLAQSRWLDFVLTEGLNVSLFLLLAAVAAAYVIWPRRSVLVVLGLLAAGMVLVRPANLPVLIVIPWVATVHGYDGWRVALGRAAWVAVAAALPLLAWCSHNAVVWDHFGLHPYTGFNAVGIAVQLVEPDDAERFADPLEARFVELAAKQRARIGCDFRDPRYFNINAHQVAGPVVRQVFAEAGRAGAPDEMWEFDRLLTRVSLRLFWLHPREYLELCLHQVVRVSQPRRVATGLLTLLAGLAAFCWTRRAEWLLMALLAAVPFAMAFPACFLESAELRYFSQGFSAGLLAPLVGLIEVARTLADRSLAEREAVEGASTADPRALAATDLARAGASTIIRRPSPVRTLHTGC